MNKIEKRIRRKKRIRSKVNGTQEKPRVSVFRSNKHLFVQLVNDASGKTLASASDSELKGKDKKNEVSFKVGELLAQKALKLKVKKIAFDKGGYKYHGRVQKLADGLRKGGLEL